MAMTQNRLQSSVEVRGTAKLGENKICLQAITPLPPPPFQTQLLDAMVV